MATWLIERVSGRWRVDGVRLYYLNHVTKKKYDCGRLTSDVPDSMIAEWIINHGGIALGDVVQLSDGSTLRFTRGGLVLDAARLDDGVVVQAGAARA